MKKIFFVFLAILSVASIANAATGYIDTSVTNHANVCYDATCTTPTPSIINFELSQQPSIVIDSVTGVSGYVWGEKLGWINMNPTGAGVSFANATTGLLTGKAWSQVSGWINFAVTGQTVIISPSSGEFGGWAWTGGPFGGWIKFDCGDASTCVKSTWRVASGGGGGGGSGPLDVCANIDGIQSAIPNGYTVDNFGHCVSIVDVCPNLPGAQATMPAGYRANEIGACVFISIDYCPNMPGVQYSIPNGYIINSVGNCIKLPADVCPNDAGVQSSYDQCSQEQLQKDICPNLLGIQETLPGTYTLTDGLCYPESLDLCPNILGSQTSVPTEYIISGNGSCIPEPDDLCDNLGGYQVIVPIGFVQDGTNCFFIQSQEGPKSSIVIALPFIPSTLWVLSDNSFVKVTSKAVYNLFNEDLKDDSYHVDLMSFSLTALFLVSFILALTIFIRKMVRRKMS